MYLSIICFLRKHFNCFVPHKSQFPFFFALIRIHLKNNECSQIDVVQPLLFCSTWCTGEMVKVPLRGSVTTPYFLNMVQGKFCKYLFYFFLEIWLIFEYFSQENKYF